MPEFSCGTLSGIDALLTHLRRLIAMKISFSCTMCGRCCHGLRLPLSIDEASSWLERGGRVELFCEAIPWPEEPAPDNTLAAHKRRRSFAAYSGQLPVRVIVSLMATFPGACPNLRADMSCGIYEDRPRACRVYPAEVNPFITLDRAGKLCPPEAWASDVPLQDEHGAWVDPEVDRAIIGMRAADAQEAEAKKRLCTRLQITTAGLSNESVVIHAPDRDRLTEALAWSRYSDAGDPTDVSDWTLASHRQRTLELLTSAASRSVDASKLDPGTTFMAFVPPDA
ncbi:MAG TPA: YkgJ family cysteine cluster protein [Luteibacter sp.]|uniref:YkgJ family cysteine cluster protein n=1 Tax=Luteibacter sp. TaxID=1886636 RepID=UPI002C554517|nr:YkgJ family cysteine cluster protein [Luteibacter sp.]HVI55922.1 YkgJ family cysteine cluster protein [Luteibacter sp.]